MTKFYKRIDNSYPFRRITGIDLSIFLTLNLFSCSDETRDIPKAGDELTFELEDLNESSETFGEWIGPHTFTPKVTLFYFTTKET